MIKCQKDEQNLKYISNLQQVRKGQMEERMCCITLMTHLLFNRLYYLKQLFGFQTQSDAKHKSIFTKIHFSLQNSPQGRDHARAMMMSPR